MTPNYAQIVLLAVIQGAAELLPVSSSAHVILAERLMGLDPSSPELTFLLVMLHTGTMLAVLVYFWPRWRARLLAPAAGVSRLHFILMVVLATALTGAVGFGLKELIERVVLVRLLGHDQGEVEHLFKHLWLMAGALLAVGVFIIVAGRREARAEAPVVTPATAAWVGVVQGLCLPFRGFSRSGATISTALCRGVGRALAEDFSFALAVVLTPPVIAWELRRLLKAQGPEAKTTVTTLLMPGLLGMAFSFVAGLVALRLLSWMLEQGRWRYFGYYCLAAAAVVAAAAFAGN